MEITENIMSMIELEINRQDMLWGKDRNFTLPYHTWLTVLLEESGEIARAVLRHSDEGVLRESIHTAAIAIQIAKGAISRCEALGKIPYQELIDREHS